jgi:uncharacterized membrane protein YoaT (DUF817 family)
VSVGSLLARTSVEDRIDRAAHRVLDRVKGPVAEQVVEFITFGLKQGWACLFGGLMLGLLLLTHLTYPADAWLARYDFLFLSALCIQIGMLALRLENFEEAKVILVFHVIGTAMELFKTHVGSWSYPEANFFRIGGVPLFSGFMYAAVGSYIARIWRIFDMRFSNYPPRWATVVLAVLIYVNFFSHHYVPDIRIGLFVACAGLFFKTRVSYRIFRYRLWMPLLLGFALVALFIWLGENIGTVTRAWLYPNQSEGWQIVHVGMLGSWFLLMIISFVLVTLIHPAERFLDRETSASSQLARAGS